MEKLIIIGKFRKDSNGCVTFSLPREESDKIDLNKKYLIMVDGSIAYTRECHGKFVAGYEH